MKAMRGLIGNVALALVLANVGCQHIGPPTIADDRLAYNDAIATSWKQQVLLNIVRLRYGDMVEFVDVGAVTQQHSLMRGTQATFGATIFPQDSSMNSLAPALMGTRTITDAPTIVYTPLADAQFNRNLQQPIKPSDLFQQIESGTTVRTLLDLGLDSINNVRNRYFVPGSGLRYDERWTPLITAIQEAHAQRDLSFPTETIPDSDDKKVLMLIKEEDSTEAEGKPVATIRNLLHLKAAVTKFEIIFGDHPRKETEIAVRTRSVLRAMLALSDYVQVPASHLAEGRAENWEGAEADDAPLLRVNSGCKKPCDAFAAIPYQGYWFWIDQRDSARSKASIIYLRTFLALADTGARPAGPVLTLPAR